MATAATPIPAGGDAAVPLTSPPAMPRPPPGCMFDSVEPPEVVAPDNTRRSAPPTSEGGPAVTTATAASVTDAADTACIPSYAKAAKSASLAKPWQSALAMSEGDRSIAADNAAATSNAAATNGIASGSKHLKVPANTKSWQNQLAATGDPVVRFALPSEFDSVLNGIFGQLWELRSIHEHEAQVDSTSPSDHTVDCGSPVKLKSIWRAGTKRFSTNESGGSIGSAADVVADIVDQPITNRTISAELSPLSVFAIQGNGSSLVASGDVGLTLADESMKARGVADQVGEGFSSASGSTEAKPKTVTAKSLSFEAMLAEEPAQSDQLTIGYASRKSWGTLSSELKDKVAPNSQTRAEAGQVGANSQTLAEAGQVGASSPTLAEAGQASQPVQGRSCLKEGFPRDFSGIAEGGSLSLPGTIAAMRRSATNHTVTSSLSHSSSSDHGANLRTIFKEIDREDRGTIQSQEVLSYLQEAGVNNISESLIRDAMTNFNMYFEMENNDRFDIKTFKDFMTSDLVTEGLTDNHNEEMIRFVREAILHCESRKMILQFTGVKQHWQRYTETSLCASFMEAVVAFTIIANAFVIGVNTDNPDWPGWFFVETCFTLIFLGEVVTKICRMGYREFCVGPDYYWNFFDFMIVLAALVDMFATLSTGDMNSNNKNLALVRLVRLLRLTRLVKLLRIKAFKELKLMIIGLFFGMRTLVWALFLFIVLLYILAVILRQSIMSDAPDCTSGNCSVSEQHISEVYPQLFRDVPRCGFTLLRCLTDGCVSIDGTPLVPHLWNVYGEGFLFLYIVTMFFVIFGLFNLITAILVENTMEAAKHDRDKVSTRRRAEQFRVARKLQSLLIRIRNMMGTDSDVGEDFSMPVYEVLRSGFRRRLNAIGKKLGFLPKGADEVVIGENAKLMKVMRRIAVTKELFEELVFDPQVEAILDDLDISCANREGLFDVLDADGDGCLSAEEFVTGLLRLRGPAEKSDVVAAVLGVRSLQRSLKRGMKKAGPIAAKLNRYSSETHATALRIERHIRMLHKTLSAQLGPLSRSET